MTDVHGQLAERIRGEMADLDRAVERALKSWNFARKHIGDQDAFIDSVALNLHGFYSGLERLFELIARNIDGNVPDASTWHRDLLHRMAEDIEGIRPAVISQENASALDEYRRFRHLVRNVYSINLLPEKLIGLMMALAPTWEKVRTELRAFSQFLDELCITKNPQ